jgi:hypothetical protein
LLFVSEPALAEEGEMQSAAAHFDQGLTLYQKGRMRDAAIEFLAAFRLAPHGDAMFNAGLALEASGDSAGAATAYAWAIDYELRPEVMAEATGRLKRLAPRLGIVRVFSPPKSTVEIPPLRRRSAATVFYALPGESLITVTLDDGSILARRARVELGTERRLDFTTHPTEAAEPAPSPVEDDDVAADSSPGGPWRTVGWVALGTGLAAGVGAYAYRKATLNARDDYVDSGNTDADARERALRDNRWTNVCLVTAIVAGAAGGGLLLFGPEPRHQTALRLGPGGLEVSGRF